MLIIADKMIENNPHRSSFLKEIYLNASNIAIKHIREDFGYDDIDTKIILRSGSVAKIFDEIKNAKNVIALTGFKSTPYSLVAGKFAVEHKIPYISALSPVHDPNTFKYVKPLAYSYYDAVEKINQLSNEYDVCLAIYLRKSTIANKYLIGLSSKFTKISFFEEVPYGEIEKNLSKKKKILLFFPGYPYEQGINIAKNIRSKGYEFSVIGSSPWSYSHNIIKNSFEGKPLGFSLYTISEFYERSRKKLLDKNDTSTIKYKRFEDAYKKNTGKDPEITAYSIYDSIYLSLMVIGRKQVESRESFLDQFSKFFYEGASGKIEAKNGNIVRDGFLLQWKDSTFEPIKKY